MNIRKFFRTRFPQFYKMKKEYVRCFECGWQGDITETKTTYRIRQYSFIGKCPNCEYMVTTGLKARFEKLGSCFKKPRFPNVINP